MPMTWSAAVRRERTGEGARRTTGLLVLGLLIALPAFGQRPDGEYSPHVFRRTPTEVFWGDTHVHSSFSMDANSIGNTRLGPDAAYRFAKGERVEASSGMQAQLLRPLDFLVVSDHSEYMGLLPALRAGDPRILADPTGQALHAKLVGAQEAGMSVIGQLIDSLMKNAPIIDNRDFKQSIWQEITRLADAANEPGRFTALIGFEWTSMPGGDNLHRVVVYGDDGEKASRRVPVSAFDGERPEDLWRFMESYEADLDGRILAIPHNANLSNGRMFAIETSEGERFDAQYARRRARLEPLVEVTQIKGDGETHPLLSPDDEFADFETWDAGNLHVLNTVPKGEGQIEFEYARSALRLGLAEAGRLGVNPFQFGMIGSSDAHTALAAVAEDDYWGKAATLEPGPRSRNSTILPADEGSAILFGTWDFVASGYAAVWATENTREALFEAMRRREVYATTGSRITLRFFGGWDYEEGDAFAHDLADRGYAGGVPMGSDLPSRSDGETRGPNFIVSALKDPDGAHLDRIQVVKGWRDVKGETHEKVYDVALSADRRSLFGRTRPVGSTVDVGQGSFGNSIGEASLAAVWRDPEFDPAQHAFYYARVLEIPTPRWNVYDRIRLNAQVPEDVPHTIQDRAYTSPIWYTPDVERSE
jgi:hypothetical protein